VPTVPVITQRVQEAALPNVRAGAEAPDSAFGIGQSASAFQGATNRVLETADNFAGLLQREAEKAKREADQIAVLGADQDLSAHQVHLEFDPVNGFRNKRGKNAFDGQDYALKEWQRKVEEIEKSLNNQEQKLAFKKLAASRYSDLNRSIQQHVHKERQEYDTLTTNSYIDNERDAAAKSYKTVDGKIDGQRISLGLQRQQIAVYEYAERNGLPEEWVKQKIREHNSKTHRAILEQMINNGEDLVAKEYFSANRDAIDVDDEDNLVRALKASSIKGEAIRLSDKILEKHPLMSDALAEAKKIKDEDVREKAEAKIKEHFSIKRQAMEEDERQRFHQAHEILSKTGRLDKVPTTLFQSLPPEKQKALEQRHKNMVEGTYVPTKKDVYYKLESMAAENPDGFAKLDLLEYERDLNPRDFTRLVTKQSNIKKGGDSAEEELIGLRTKKQIVDDLLRDRGLDPTPNKPGSKDAQQVNEFRSQLDELIIDFRTTKGKKPSAEEIKAMAEKLMVKTVVEKPFWFDSEKMAFDLKIEDIPASEKAKISEAIKRKRLPVSEKLILKLYREKVSRGQQ
jgi:hypothetical protein